ncbi:MAG: hypothetical protein QOE90_1340 [Thermoplasmata archaeon]|jgi:hypothetical protein|nr:hypothetical protein [Thermoplasmata archaeon]
MRTKALLLATVLLAAALAGCSARAQHPDPKLVQATANTKADRWQTGDWWSYHATLNGNQSLDVDLVVDRAAPEGFTLGTNASSGFFGLPFLGNVTRGLNPQIGDEVWPMFQFPLSDGASWSYHLWGHDARAEAHATVVDVPGSGPEPGFAITATSLGQVFARYDYAPGPGWFTHLELLDPGKGGKAVLVADLRAYGSNYHGLYYVEETLATLRLAAPMDLPTPRALAVPAADSPVRVHMVVAWTAGACDATIQDESRQTLAHAQVLAQGAASADATLPQGAHVLALDPKCVGSGTLYLVATGVRARQGLAG